MYAKTRRDIASRTALTPSIGWVWLLCLVLASCHHEGSSSHLAHAKNARELRAAANPMRPDQARWRSQASTESLGISGERLRSIHFKGDDGTLSHLSWQDNELDIECRYWSGDGFEFPGQLEMDVVNRSVNCLPVMYGIRQKIRCRDRAVGVLGEVSIDLTQGWFEDAACTKHIPYGTLVHPQEVVEIVERFDQKPCAAGHAAGTYRAINVRQVEETYTRFQDQCIKENSFGSTFIFELGEPIDPAKFAQGRLVMRSGQGR